MRPQRWTATEAPWKTFIPSGLTGLVFSITLGVSLAAMLNPVLMASFTGDAQLMLAGDWWRSFTPILVQPSGWGQLIFNLVGLGLVGTAMERRVSRGDWVAIYLLGGVGSIAVLSALQPHYRDGGSSNAVAALIGALSVLLVLKPPPDRRDWVAQLYSVFFATYLTALLLGGVWWSIILGDISVVALFAARRAFAPRLVARLVLGIVLGCALLQAAWQDGHGIGLLIGMMVSLALVKVRAVIKRP